MKTVKYGQGKIYKIVNDITGLCYIGSTIEKYLSNRLSKHKSSYKRYLKGLSKQYCTSFKVLEQEGFRIELIEHYPCQSKYELENRERYWIEKLDCVNKIIPTRTDKEYREQNKEKIKEYREKNKEKILEQTKQYRETNEVKIKQRNKEYREANKAVLALKKKEWREANLDRIKEQKNQKHTCECGARYTHGHKSRHLKTKKHNLYIQNQNEEKLFSDKEKMIM